MTFGRALILRAEQGLRVLENTAVVQVGCSIQFAPLTIHCQYNETKGDIRRGCTTHDSRMQTFQGESLKKRDEK